MIKLRAYLAYGITKTWTLLALLLVVSAVAISLLRFSLPYIDRNKHLVEEYIAQHYAAELNIGSISASWVNTGPSLVLNDVALRDSSSNRMQLSVERVYVEVDFWQSLSTLSLKSNRVKLDGVDLDVHTHRTTTKDTQTNIVNVITRLFFERLQQFSLTNSRLTINTQHNSHSYVLENVQWVNQENRHQAVGQMRVAQLADNSASFVLDLNGDIESLSGQFFVQGDRLDFSPWINEWINEDQNLLNSQGNFKVWTRIEDSKVVGLQAEILPSQFEWQSADDVLITKLQYGQIIAEPSRNSWIFNINDLILSTNDQSLSSDFTGSIDYSGNMQIASLNTMSLSPLMALFPLFVDSQQAQLLSQTNPLGKITQFALRSSANELAASAKLKDLSWSASGNLPGLSNLSAELVWHEEQGLLTLETVNATLDTQGLLDKALDLNYFNASFYVYQQASLNDPKSQGWHISSDSIEFASDSISFTQQLNFDFSQRHLSLATQVQSIPVAQVPDLFSSQFMGTRTKDYLTRAIREQVAEDQAKVELAQFIWQGQLNAFPFADNQGVFQASVDITNARFLFSDQWPRLTNLDINLLFENDSLTMRSNSSQLQQISLTNLVATIPNLLAAEKLEIDVFGAGQASAVADLMNSSQMKSSLGTLLSEDIVVSGPIQADLNLSIPLNATPIRVSGEVLLEQNTVHIPPLGLEFQQANGRLSFVNDSVNFEQITTTFLGQPIQLSLSGRGSDSGYQAHIGVVGDVDLDQFLGNYFQALDQYVDGHADVEAEIDLLVSKDGFEYAAILHSPMTTLTSRMPPPFFLDEKISKPLWLNITGNKTASIIDLTLGAEVAFSGVLPHAEAKFSRAHLAIAEDPSINLGGGFSVSVDIDELNLRDWYQTLSTLRNDVHQTGRDILGTPQRVFINTKKMLIDDNAIDNVHFIAKQRHDNWSLDLSAKQLKTQIFIPNDYLNRGIEIDTDFLRMDNFSRLKTHGSQWQMQNIPPFRFSCAQCQLGRFDLGEVNVEASKNPLGLVLERIEMENANGKLIADGLWQFNRSTVNTAISGTLMSSDFGLLLKQMGLNSGIKDSRANFEFVLNWPDAPWAIVSEQLKGEVDWSLSDGYLTEVSDQGSRIFTLFSLNSLVRKLSLDFRDVFAQGFFYDDIQGSLQIDDGKAYTDDTIVDGGAGEITINGYTDLAQNKLNYRVAFTPNVTGNLPILMYFMVNPPTALAALALDQMLTSAKVISNINYSVTGTIDKPVVSEIDRDSQDVELPARVPSIKQPVIPGRDNSFIPPLPVSIDTLSNPVKSEDG